MSTLEIRNLHAQVIPNDENSEPKPILKGVDLTIKSGEIHAIMGPNGSGKSTLAYTLAGHPRYEITDGEVLLDGENLLDMDVDERARAGLFLAMHRNPRSVNGELPPQRRHRGAGGSPETPGMGERSKRSPKPAAH